ncbi:MAG TPA: urate oxidase [Candidatus Limnocylindrales bacterium]
MIELGGNRYGKEAIRLVKIVRGASGHAVRDLTVGVQLEGDFAAAHVDGDNAMVVATDTMKNTVYAFAKDRLTGAIEAFALELARHFLRVPQVGKATIRIREHGWRPIDTDTGPAADAFVRSGELTRLATVTSEADGDGVAAGIEDLVVMKTAGSAFAGFPRDEYTTLPETRDRIMATRVSATWRYAAPATDLDHDALFAGIRATLMDSFAGHHSRSVQESIWILGHAVLERHPEVAEISMAMPNLHHWRVDLSPFGLANDNVIFVATTEPYGLIEATVRRG